MLLLSVYAVLVNVQDVDLAGVPPLAPCRITLNESVPPAVAAAIRDKEQQLPSREQMAFRDPTGSYSAVAPFWANISNARCVEPLCAGPSPSTIPAALLTANCTQVAADVRNACLCSLLVSLNHPQLHDHM